MRIYRDTDGTEIKNVTLLLTRDEAHEMLKAIEKLREKHNDWCDDDRRTGLLRSRTRGGARITHRPASERYREMCILDSRENQKNAPGIMNCVSRIFHGMLTEHTTKHVLLPD